MQAQLYVNGAREATKLVRCKRNAADAVESQRVAYRAACGSAPTREWEADANIMAELAAVGDADEEDLETHFLSWGPVPAGTWQAIGDKGVVHYGPGTDALRVIIVLVLTVKSDDKWEAVQHAVPSVLLSGSNALGLVKWRVVDEIATRYFQNRTKLDGATYEAYMDWLGRQRQAFEAKHRRSALAEDEDLSTPEKPDFLPYLAELLGAQRWHYTVHAWIALFAMAFISEVVDHAAVARGDELLLEDYVEEFERPTTNTRSHVRKLKFSPEHVGRWQHRWEPVFDAQHKAKNDKCVCEACSSPVVEGYSREAEGVERCPKTGGWLRYHWDTQERLPPDVYGEAFRIERGSLTVRSPGEADLVFEAGETGVLHAEFAGELRWQEEVGLRKAYEHLGATKRPHGNAFTCDTCGLGCGDEYYSWAEAASNCSDMINDQLKEVCRRLGKPVSGKKSELLGRIREANNDSLIVAQESKELCRVCYLKRGPDWAAGKLDAVRRYRHGNELPLSQAEQSRVDHFIAGALRERRKYAREMDASDLHSEEEARAKLSAMGEFHC